MRDLATHEIYTPKPSSNRSLFKLTISDQTLIRLPKHVHLNGQTLSGVLEYFSFTPTFLG